MSGIVKVLLGLVLGLPVGAYAVGSLVASAADEPTPRAPIILRDPSPSQATADPSSDPSPSATPSATPDEPDDEDDDLDDESDGDDDGPAVVVPSYADLDDDEDDHDDDHSGHGGGDDDHSGHGGGDDDERDGDDD